MCFVSTLDINGGILAAESHVHQLFFFCTSLATRLVGVINVSIGCGHVTDKSLCGNRTKDII